MLSVPQRLEFTVPASEMSPTAHRMICWQWGRDDAPRTVLCVHGLTRNGRDFDVLAAALAGDCRVLCPDMPGRGESQWLPDAKGYSNPAYVADLFFLLAQLRIERVQWVGTSMGGILGMMAANSRPGLIQALALNDIGCIVSATGLKRIAAYAGAQPVFTTLAQAQAALRERCAPFGIHSEAQWQLLFAHSFQQRPDGMWIFACDPQIMAAIPPETIEKDIDLWPLWEAVTKIPVLLLRGASSDILSKETELAMQARHPQLTYKEIEGAGHAPALMDDDQVNSIRDWLAKA